MELKSKHKQIQSWFFSKGRLPINLNFKMNNMELEIVSEFIHMGNIFAEKASKAMYDILNKGRVHNLSDKSERIILIAFRQLISTRMT
jgi:hypothetical protein